MTGDAPRVRTGFAASVARVFDVALPQMLWSRRSVFLALLVGAPIGMAVVIRTIAALLPDGVRAPMGNVERVGGPLLFGMMVWLLYARFIVPVLGVFYGTGLIADEVDDKTITYLFTRPIRRGSVLVGKYLAYLVCTTLVVLPSVVIVYFLIVPLSQVARTFTAFAADLGLLAPSVYVLAALGTVTVLQRIFHVRSELRASGGAA